jgi:coproporphyrinogen III oxidase
MLELIDGNHLIMNNYYYVKCKKENRHVQFLEYDNIRGVNFAICLCMNHVICLYTHNRYYKYVTKKDFLKKVKEKYDAKCLDIVLKRLVDESLEW